MNVKELLNEEQLKIATAVIFSEDGEYSGYLTKEDEANNARFLLETIGFAVVDIEKEM